MTRPTDSLTLTFERADELLRYDPETGDLFWRKSRRGRYGRAGARAGTLNDKGYVIITIDGRRYRASRLAWLLTHGALPEGVVDHKDRARANNKERNLRDVTVAVNAQNKAAAGVAWNRTARKWRAYIVKDRKYIHLGQFQCLGRALNARRRAKNEHHATP